MQLNLSNGVYRHKQLLHSPDSITTVASYDSNLYLGTETGELLHYHRFNDSPDFILLSQQKLRNAPIKNLVVVPKSERVVALCGGTMFLFLVPELSPVQLGKLKDVEHVLTFHTNDLIVTTKDKVRIIRFVNGEVKLLKAVLMSSIMSIGHKSNNLITVATGKQYRILNPEDGSDTSLFDYDELGNAKPNIVSYIAKDTGKEELLLTIKSDDQTSIGMFITGEGDPARGTLSWIDKGYASNGVVVQWPYVFAVFEGTRLLVTSLVDFSIVSEIDLPGTLMFLPHGISAQDDNYTKNGICERDIMSSMVVYDSNSVGILYRETATNIFLEQLQEYLTNEGPAPSVLENETDPLYNQLLFLYMVLNKEYTRLNSLLDKSFDDIIVFLFTGEMGDLQFYNGVQTILNILRDKIDGEFKSFALQHIRTRYLTDHEHRFQHLAYSNFDSSEEFIEFSKKDKASWTEETTDIKNIIKKLESKKFYSAVLHLYILLGNSWQICHISQKFLSNEYHDSNSYNFPDLILQNLGNVDDAAIYRDSLLEILRVEPKKGISYMKKHVNGKFKNTHDEILSQSQDLSSDEDFARLKLDVLEMNLREGNASTEELLNHILTMLQEPNEIASNNISILYQTYLIESNFISPKGATSWVSFLSAIKGGTECKEFIDLYLKAYELLNHTELRPPSLQILKDIPTFEFFKCCFVDDSPITSLLDFKDYYSAEFFALYNKMPYLSPSYYVVPELVQASESKQNLSKVLDSYKASNYPQAIRHFINTYGSMYSPGEILDILPSEFSLAFAQDYLIDLFVGLESKHRFLALKKLLTKQEIKAKKQLYNDLTR